MGKSSSLIEVAPECMDLRSLRPSEDKRCSDGRPEDEDDDMDGGASAAMAAAGGESGSCGVGASSSFFADRWAHPPPSPVGRIVSAATVALSVVIGSFLPWTCVVVILIRALLARVSQVDG